MRRKVAGVHCVSTLEGIWLGFINGGNAALRSEDVGAVKK